MEKKKQSPSYKMDAEEKEILHAFEKEELKSNLKNRNELKTIEDAARNTLLKNQRINIRLPDTDLKKIKERAAENGIPYQTLIGTILHQYAVGKLTISV